MKLFPDVAAEATTTIIRWNESDEDTVACEVRRDDNSTIVAKVWYNGHLAYDDASGLSRDAQLSRLISVRK